MTSPISALLTRAAHRRALHELARLDGRMLREAGLARTEAAFAISDRKPTDRFDV